MNEAVLSKLPKSAAGSKTQRQAAVTDAIRQAILTNELAPGHRLVETELCELLGAGRGSVRAALMDLVHEGLVEHVANRGARVRIIGIEEALQIAEVRLAVESLCVGKAAERVTDDEIAQLRQHAAALRQLAGRNDIAAITELTHQVRQDYIRIADQAVARGVLERLRDQNLRYQFTLSYMPNRAQVLLPLWLGLIDAICDRQPDAARQALAALVENTKQAMLALAQGQSALAPLNP